MKERVVRSEVQGVRFTPDESRRVKEYVAAQSKAMPFGVEVGIGDMLRAIILATVDGPQMTRMPTPSPSSKVAAKPSTPKPPAPPSRLRIARESAGLSQNALAVAVGCDPSLVSQVERGKTALSGALLAWVEAQAGAEVAQ